MEKRNSADSWDGVKIEQLAKAYVEVREEMWEVLAKLVDEKWQDVEKKVRPVDLISLPARSCDVRKGSPHAQTSIPTE